MYCILRLYEPSYTEWKPLGLGVSGLVCSARDQLTHRTVAVKKLVEPFKTPAIARHMFREMKLLRQLRHENVSIPSG